MTKVYASSIAKNRFTGKALLIVFVMLAGFVSAVKAQVTVFASLGNLNRSYATLREAFGGINDGTHQGSIEIHISANTNEGASAVLNSSGAGAAAYTSVTVFPDADNITVTGNPGAGRGVIELNGADNVTIDGDNPNSGGNNRNLTILNADAPATIGGSCIRLATNTNVTSTDAITIQNCILNGNVTGGNSSSISNPSSSSNFSWGIYAGGAGGASATTAPTALNATTPDKALATTTMANLLFQNNQINQVGQAIQINGAAATVTNSLTVTDNLIGPAAPSATCVYMKGILVGGASSVIANNNTIRNINSYVGIAMSAIELVNPIGAGVTTINNNTITNIKNAGNNGAVGIQVTSIGAPFTVSGNTIAGIEGSGDYSYVNGIQINATGGIATVEKNKVSAVNGINPNNRYTVASGIYLRGAANGAIIRNNFIWDIKHNYGTFTINQATTGIGIAAGSNHKIYNNTVSLRTASASPVSTSVSCLGVFSNTFTGMDIRNNIFDNSLAPVNGTSVSTCIFLPFTVSAGMNYTINNNGYYTNGSASVAFAGNTAYNAANVYANLAAWSPIAQGMGNGSNEVYSLNPAGAAPIANAGDLHIPNGTTTALESGGAPLGIADDIDNQARNATTPDIGADEFSGTPVDNVPPTISYVLPTNCSVSKMLTATITDASGVPTTNGSPQMPVLKWRINAGAWQTVQGTYTGTPGEYTFNFGGGVNLDVIQYYLVAQDNFGNIIASPAAGAGGYTTNPTDATIPPTSPYSYTNLAGLVGTLTVGPTGTYATLTAAATAFNTSCLSGNILFELQTTYTATYSAANETYPIIFNNSPYTNGTTASYTVTIKPAAGASPVISGASGQTLIKLNGADRIIIDGSNTVGGTTRDLTITNTDQASSASIIWINAASATDGATNNVIKNTNINSPYFGGVPVVLQGIYTTANAANSNNTIQNNAIKGVYSAIYIVGKTPTGFDQNWLIADNLLGSTISTEKLGLEGMELTGCQNFTISNNTIQGIANIPNATEFLSGIVLLNYTSNGSVYNNKISDIKYNDFWGTNGIYLASNNPASDIKIYNNFIWDIAGTGWSNYTVDDNGYGIMVDAGGGYKIYYNSVSMSASQSTGYPAAINIGSGVTANNALDIRNNIFSNTGTGGTRFSIISLAPASVFQFLDFNDYWFAGSTLGRISNTNAPDISTWRALTSKDASSVSVNPQFIAAASNLHLNTATSTLNHLATPLGGYTTDIDGDTRDASTPDIGADEFTGTPCAGAPSAGTATASTALICISGTVSLASTGYSLAEGINFQWQWASDAAFTTPNNIASQTNPAAGTYVTAGANVWLRLKATCTNGGGVGYSNVLAVTVSNPQVTGTTVGSHCGIGSVTLSATGSANTTLDWYLTPEGGTVLGSGTTFNTPVISSSTTFYVAAQPNPASYPAELVKNYSYSTSTGTSLDPMSGATSVLGTGIDDLTADTIGIGFTFRLAGTNYTKFSVSSNGWIMLGNTAPTSASFTNTLTSNSNLPKIVPFWDDLTTGNDGGVSYVVTGTAPFRVLKVQFRTNRFGGGATGVPASMTFQVWMYESSNIIEIRYGAMSSANDLSSSVGLVAATNDYQSVTISTSTASIISANDNNTSLPASGRMYRFVPPGPSCQSPRTSVLATINAAPPINAAVASPANICDGQSTTLTVSSASDPNYTYTWTPGGATGTSVTVSPSTTTEYTVNALYTGPGVNNGCTNQSAVTVVVTQSPPIITLNPVSASVCPAQSTVVNVTSGTESTDTAQIGVSTTNQNGPSTTTDAPGMPPFGGFYTGNRHQILYRASELTALGFVAGTVLNSVAFDVVDNTSTVGYNGFTIKIGHTTNNSLNTTFLSAASTQVYLGNFAAGQPAAGWNTFAFGTGVGSTASFTWDGTSNILVETYFTNCASGNCSGSTCSSTGSGVTWLRNVIMNNSPAGFSAHSMYFSDGNSCDIGNRATASGTVNYRPNTRFGYNTTFAITWTEVPNNGTLVVNSPTQVTVTPNVTTTYTATTTNTLGCPRTKDIVVTVNSTTASVSIVASPVSPICAGTSVTFTATPTNGGPGPLYQWQINGGNQGVPTTSNTLTTTTLNTGDQVSVIMTSNLTPCTPAPVTSNIITMTVNPKPTCNITGPNSVCAASTGNVYTNTISPVGGTVVHNWTITGNGSIVGPTNGASVTVTAGAAGSYTLTDAVTRDGCSPASVCSYVVTVNPNLPVSVSIAASPTGAICTGTSVTFTATPTNGGGTPGYQWQVNGINQPGETNVTFTTSTLTNGDIVTVVLTSNATCATGSPATSNQITMSVTNAAPASVTIAASNACVGQSVTLTATPTFGGASPTYDFWVGGSQVTFGQSSNTYTFTPGGPFSAYVVLHSSLLCPNPNNATSATINVTPNPVPVLSIGATCTNILVGSGQQTTITVTSTPNTGVDYTWTLLPSTSVPGNTPTQTTGITGTYQVNVSITSTGCSAQTSITINPVTPSLVAGTYPIPSTGCSGFATIASAVNYINNYGVAGAVVFDIAAGYSETAPVGGYAITATGTSANTITFQKAAGVGAVTITSNNALVSGSINDAFFKLIGSDYITIKGLTMVEHGGTQTTTPASNNLTEWGIALLQGVSSPGTNGARNNLIQDNNISLVRAYEHSFGIYSNANHNASAPTAAITITNATGSNSNNRFYGNTISQVNTPILIDGPATVAYHDTGNDIGGNAIGTGNIITDWGGKIITITYADVNANLYTAGISAKNQLNDNISYNSLSTTGITVTSGAVRGVLRFYTALPTLASVSTIKENIISLPAAMNMATAEWEGIYITYPSTTLVASHTINVTDNHISGVLSNATGASNIYGINSLAYPATLNVSNNEVGPVTTSQTTGAASTFYGIYLQGTPAVSKVVDNNNLHDINSGSTTFYGINITNVSGASVQNNVMTNLTNAGTGTTYAMQVAGSSAGATATVSQNNITNINGTGQITAINVSGSQIFNFTNNTLNGLTTTSGTAVVTAIQAATAGAVYSNNTFTNFNVNSVTPNTASVHGMLISANSTVTNNIFSNFSSNSATGNTSSTGMVNGLYISANSSTLTINKNKFFNFICTGSGRNISVNGIYIAQVKAITITNNFISDLKAPNTYTDLTTAPVPSPANADAIHGIISASTTAASNVDIFYNTIYLNATNTVGTDFGTSGIFHTGNATGTVAALNLRNNIIVNTSNSRGAGLTSAFRRTIASLSNYAASSNNNDFYAGVPSATNLIYTNGTTNYSDLASFQAHVTTRENKSISVMPFFRDIAATPYDLRLTLDNNCSFDGQGDNTGILLADDIEGDARMIVSPYTTDIGADEFAGTGPGIGVWTGNFDSNWMEPRNWCGAVPTSTMNVTIPAGSPLYPIITNTQPVAKNITINAGGSVTISGSGKLAIYGTITNSGTFNTLDGGIEMASSSPQTIPAGAFQNNDLKNLIINNASVTLAGPLKLYGKLSFVGSNRTLATAGNLTLRSTATTTASVGDITNNSVNSGNTITGDVTVERFITARRAWRLLSVPTQHNLQTIHESWQENMPANSTAQSTPAGYGLHLTSENANWSTYGFDLQTPAGPSIKTYNPATNNWDGLKTTVNVVAVSDGKFQTGVGYMTLIRGDRTVNTFPQAATSTTLREKGALVLGSYAGAPSVPAGKFQVIGNPYASAIDFGSLSRSPSIDNTYYMWDPQMGTLGAYVTFAGPTYDPTASISYDPNHYIESGQAFFVHSSAGAGSVTFNEPAKVDGSNLVTRQANSNAVRLRTKLFAPVDNSMRLFDGTVNEFSAEYSNAVDELDAIKPTNFSENLAVKVGDKLLSYERHAEIVSNDTIFYNLTQVRATNYRFEFVPENMDPLLTGYLMDRYLNTSTVVNMLDTTRVEFTVVNEPGSYAADRFYLVFKRSAPVPVTFINVKAERQNRNNLVSWQVAHEDQIGHYEVERSGTGNGFAKVHEEPATGSSNYQWLDIAPLGGDNYYRIKAVGVDNDIKYSQIVKVSAGKGASQIAVYPNPVKDDRMLYVDMQNKEAGKYQVQLLNEAGQVVMTEVLNHVGGSSVYTIQLKQSVSHGNYMLKVNREGDVKLSFKVVY